MNFNLSFTGTIHSLACVYAMLLGGLVIFANKGGALHRARGQRYVIALLVVNLTALGIYTTKGFSMFHWMAIITLLSLFIAFAAVRWKWSKAWLRIHLSAILLSYYMLWGGAINEAFLRVESLHTLGNKSWLALSHSFVMFIAFLAIAFFWGKTSKPLLGYGTLGLEQR
ncbi:MAG: hypothetical protein K2Y28_06625 [Burkholderiaceae bacterium]|nr:hypothetical protein [Burkholderiaceae bacterium]